jgi:hypothetical protein
VEMRISPSFESATSSRFSALIFALLSSNNDAIVLSSAQFGQMPEQRLCFIPIYFAGAIGN